MLKKLVMIVFVVLLLGIIYLALDIKDAYKVLPIKSSSTLEVPPFADWREFEAQSKRFKLLLPAPPQYAKESVAIPNTDQFRRYEMYVSQKLDGPIFMINLITYPSDIDVTNSEHVLHSVVDEMMKTKPDNKLVQLHDTFFQNHFALDFTILNETYNVRGLAFIVNKTVYLLTYIAKLADFTLGDYEHFIDSFQLLPRGEKSNGAEKD